MRNEYNLLWDIFYNEDEQIYHNTSKYDVDENYKISDNQEFHYTADTNNNLTKNENKE